MQSDQFLITQFQAATNKEACFTELLKRHQQKVYYQVKRMVTTHADADDIAQQVWIKVWNKLDGFKMESEFGTWVFRIAYNESLNFLQKLHPTGGENFRKFRKYAMALHLHVWVLYRQP